MRFLPLSLLCLFLQGCSAGEDLGGMAFTFPAETDYSSVKLQLAKGPSSSSSEHLREVSVCLRYFTDLPQKGKEQSFFSLATPAHSNGFLLSKLGRNRHQMYIGSGVLDFWNLQDELNDWNSFCATWDSKTGLTQVWLNGIPSARKTVFKGGSLTGKPFVVLGQDQDEYGGGLHANDALVGQLTDVHMWSRVISSCDIKSFSENRKFERGDMINWHDLEFTVRGHVVLEAVYYKSTCFCVFLFTDVSQPTLAYNNAFTFGAETANSYVKVVPVLEGRDIKVATVCLRYFSDIPGGNREQTFFSLATPSYSNGFLVCKEGRNRHQLYVGNARADFWGLPDDLNAWISFCATWDSATGLAQVWVNGRPSSRKSLFKGGVLAGTAFVVLGQDQDAYGGRFNTNDALIGQLTDVHMWDRVISHCEIQQFVENKLSGGGNVINWHEMGYTTHGNVVEEVKIAEDAFQKCPLPE
ncbi:hypothetical protein ACEWY4_017669 [Coilia grayii]|uniref:Pentraxin (PTX) domain-containing protein n=1 Tax=Coilia grayii TaxID=363190 RepID=A0ABD1JJR1_9TELE